MKERIGEGRDGCRIEICRPTLCTGNVMRQCMPVISDDREANILNLNEEVGLGILNAEVDQFANLVVCSRSRPRPYL